MKNTAKYSKAKFLIDFPHSTQEELYQELNRQGVYWNQTLKKWERNDTPASEPTKLIRVRVWTDGKQVEAVADSIIKAVKKHNLKLLERSNPYPCRPPNQLDSRVYLTFEKGQ